MLTKSIAMRSMKQDKEKGGKGSGSGSSKGGNGSETTGNTVNVLGHKKGTQGNEDAHPNVHYESSHRLLQEIVMGLFADAELQDTNFQKKTIQAAKEEAEERIKEDNKDKTEGTQVLETGATDATGATGATETTHEGEVSGTKDRDGTNTQHTQQPPLRQKSMDDINARVADYSSLFHHESNRAMFVKLLNLQRSKVQDVGVGYNALSILMCNYLDCCAKQSDVRSAKMIMIMSETFYRNRKVITGSTVDAGTDESRRAALAADGRTDTREYLQTHIRQHEIWHNPHFWEEAFFMSCREEVRKHMERASEIASQDPAEFQRVYVNICFGQLGSYALNMINFGVSIDMTCTFIHKMCGVNNLTKEQRLMLIENAKNVAASAIEAGENRRGSVVAPKFASSGTPARSSSGVSSSQEGDEDVEYM